MWHEDIIWTVFKKKIQSNKIRINKSLKILHATENHVTLWQALLHLCCFKVSYPTKQTNMYECFRKDRWFIVLVEDWFLSSVFGIWFLQIIKKPDIFPTVIYWTAVLFFFFLSGSCQLWIMKSWEKLHIWQGLGYSVVIM